jgi:hypothetical protein
MDEFKQGTNWQQSSSPHVNITVTKDDLWPHGDGADTGGGDKDELVDGRHPILAIGDPADRPIGQSGVVVSVNAETEQVVVNIAKGYRVRAFVANVLTYDQGAPDTFEIAPNIGQPVYIDDSAALSEGVVLSLSPENDQGDDNVLAGFLHYMQDEYVDAPVGGPHAVAAWPKTWGNELEEHEVCVILV